jgi:hypothetical protein
MHDQNIVLVPGWIKRFSLFRTDINFTVCRGKLPANDNHINCIIGYSLGALIALRDWKLEKISKLILINPPLPKRNVFIWLYRWTKYSAKEGLAQNIHHFTFNPIRLILEIITGAKLLMKNYSEIIKNIPKNNLFVIKGEKDEFFCDNRAVNFLKSLDKDVIEIKSVGHNWHIEIENTIKNLI